MKQIKKILFTIIVICTSLFFTSKVMAFSCKYVVYAPFESTSTDLKELAYILNFKYAYKRMLNHSNDDYLNLLQSLKTKYFLDDSYANYMSAKHYTNEYNQERILFTQDDDAISKYLLLMNEFEFGVDAGAITKQSWYTDDCYDVLTIGNFPLVDSMSGTSPWVSFNNVDIELTDRGFVEIDEYPVKEPMYIAIKDAINSEFYQKNQPLLLISDSAETKLAMATIFIEVGYHGIDFDNDYNIDGVVYKYLAIDGFKEAIDKINNDIDSSSVSSDSYYLEDSIKEKIINNVFDFYSQKDLEILSAFNSNFAISSNNGQKVGIRYTIKQYLSSIGSGLTVTQWFDEYAKDSHTKYAEALEILLEILNDDEVQERLSLRKKVNDLSKNYYYCKANFSGDEEKIKENCISSCQDYYNFQKDYDCRNEMNVTSCLATHRNDYCYIKTADEITTDISETIQNIVDDTSDIIDKKFIEYYENHGIEISETEDLCDILLGKNDENGLYVYIKGVLNAIRIGGPILVVFLTAFDAMKSISSFKDDENKKFWNHLKIRLICVAILILVPTIINFLVKLAISECVVEV